MMQRLSPMDAAFLYGEDGRSHNDVAMVLTFDGPALTRAELIQAVADRLALLPRFRQKLRPVPFAVAMPVWVDDVSFELGRHVIAHAPIADPDPVGCAVSQVMSEPMDVSLPLWQVHLFPGLPDARWLLILRLHHAMVDGALAGEIVQILLSSDPQGEPVAPDQWTPKPEPSDARLLIGAASDAGKAAAHAFGMMLHSATNAPPPVPTALGDIYRSLKPGIPISPTAINGPVHARRRWGMTEIGLDAVKDIARAYKATVNDVILAACARGFSAFIASRQHMVEHRVLRAVVPISLRSAASRAAPDEFGNQITAMVAELPLGAVAPREQIQRISDQTKAFKQLTAVTPTQSANPTSALLSPLILLFGTRAASHAPVAVNTVITNVPGPQRPLYLSGRRMHRLAACIALWAPLRLAISALSYDGVVTLGVVSDAAAFPDVEPLLDAIADGLAELAP